VRRILTTGGRSGNRVVGVQLGDGTELAASAVASSIDPHWTFERLLSPDELPEEFAQAVSRIDYSSASAKINLALSEPPRFTCLKGIDAARGDVPPHLHGTIHISPTMDYIERAYDDAKYGRPSQSPVLEMTMATSVDDTIAPPGKHLVGMFVQYAPYRLKVGQVSDAPGKQDLYPASDSWDDVKEAFADRCIEILAEYAPNVPGAILHRQVLSPLDLERRLRHHRRQYLPGSDDARPALRAAAGARLGRSSHSHRRSLSLRRGQPSRRRRDGRLRAQRGARDAAGGLDSRLADETWLPTGLQRSAAS